MAEIENLILEQMRAIRADVATMRADMREMRERQNEVLIAVTSIRRDQAHDAETVAHVQARLDRPGDRLDRVERRLDIHDEAAP